MKKMKKNSWKQFVAVAGLIGITTLSSCMKNKNDDFKPKPQAGLFVMHAAPGIGSMDIYLNGEKATNEAFSYTDNSTAGLTPNDYKIAFVSPGGDTVAVAEDSLKDKNTYSAILYSADSTNADSAKLMLFEDLRDSGAQGSATYLRFLQLSPSVKGVTIFTDKDKFQEDRQYADNLADPLLAKFRPWSAGTYSITATDFKGDTIDQLKGINLQLNSYNTLYLSGINNPTVTDSLRVKLRIAHSY